VLQKGLKEEEVIDGEGLSKFVEEADVPDFVEGLSDVKEGRRAVGFAVSDNLHFTFHPLFLQANQACML
jgi:hypothetical protein